MFTGGNSLRDGPGPLLSVGKGSRNPPASRRRGGRIGLPAPCGPGALTDADIPAAAMTVKDADDGDYSTNFTLTVKNGRLALSNSKAAGLTIIVR